VTNLLRTWQSEALFLAGPIVTGDSLARSMISAVMGAGKSRLILEMAKQWRLHRHGHLVITTPTIALVEQLSRSLADGGVLAGLRYTHGETHPGDHRVLLACNNSAPELAWDLCCLGYPCDLWIVDEAHRTECATMVETNRLLAPRAVVGLTATPYLPEKIRSLGLFVDLLYDYDWKRALADGVIVPWRVVNWDGEDTDIETACLNMIKKTEGPGIVNALTIDDAELCAKTLTEQGIPTKAIHSQVCTTARRVFLRELEKGSLRALVHVDVLREGVDLPWLRWLCLRRPARNRVAAIQELGRVLRAAPRKTEAIILDPRDQLAEMSLSYEAALGGSQELADELSPRRRREDMTPGEIATELLHISDPAVRVHRTIGEVRAILRRLEAEGHLDRQVKRGSWRYLEATDRQRQALSRLSWIARRMGPLGPLWIEASELAELKRGEVSDLLELALFFARKGGDT